jgi:hypothetical protein
MLWIYLCRDRGGAWAVLRLAPAPEGATTEGLELRLLGVYEQEADGLAAVADVNLRLAEQAERGRWRHRNGHLQRG